MASSLNRFVQAQANSYHSALAEIQRGRKTGHWMWYIFPQLTGLGFSETARYYGLNGLAEAEAYVAHPVLGPRLIGISKALLDLPTHDAHAIFGSPDDLKLRSCMTLFSRVQDADAVFQAVLDHYYQGQPDPKTLQLLQQDV